MQNKLIYWFAGLLAAQLLFMLAIFPAFEFSFGNEPLKILDLRRGYTLQEVLLLMEQLGEEGRLQYQHMILWADMLYPLVYGSLLAVTICMSASKSLHRIWGFAPLLTVFADYTENLLNLRMLNSYPVLNSTVVYYSSLANQIKWYSLYTIMLGIIILYLQKRFKQLKNQQG